MDKKLIFTAVSAALGTSCYFSRSGKILLILLLYFIFLYMTAGFRHLLLQCAAAALFFSSAHIAAIRQKTVFTGRESSFLITFSEMPDFDGSLMKSPVKSRNESLQLFYSIGTEEEKSVLQQYMGPGVSCLISGKLEKPEVARNENGFDYKKFLIQKNISWILRAKTLSLDRCRHNPKNPAFMISSIRAKGISYISKHFPESSKGFVSALIFGDGKEIGEEDYLAYQRLGIVHLLAISGLHVSFLTGILFYLGIRMGITREKMSMIILILLPAYMILSGGSPSVLRSCLMAMLYFFLSLCRKKQAITASMACVFLFLLLYRPYMLFNIGFQLSFLVSFSIVLSAPILKKYPNHLHQLLIMSIICQLASIPVILYHFYEVSMLGIFLNVLYVPLYSILFLPFSMIALAFSIFLPHLSEPLIVLLDLLFRFCSWLAERISKLPLSYLTFGKPAYWTMLLLSLSIFILFIQWERTSLSKCRKAVFFLAAVLLVQYHINKFSPFGEVTFLDVGQGDSILIQLPYSRGNYLIDTGGQLMFHQEKWKERRKVFDTGSGTIIPLLKSKGIHSLDKLILTHPDTDHIGSADKILAGIEVKQIVLGMGNEQKYREKDFIQTAARKGIPVAEVKRGDRWKAGEAEFFVLNPYRTEEETNESSIVLFAKMGGLTWLFTGDFGVKSEGELLRTYPGLSADILKAGHHGSKTSSSAEFLNGISPMAAVISAGKNNRYGHPHQETLKALSMFHIKVFRTDEQGAVTYRFSGRRGTFSTSLP
ncbi:DNA internalization-related competence protein ComEC/Rec2 [Actinomycetes bacterium NPDC127524]